MERYLHCQCERTSVQDMTWCRRALTGSVGNQQPDGKVRELHLAALTCVASSFKYGVGPPAGICAWLL